MTKGSGFVTMSGSEPKSVKSGIGLDSVQMRYAAGLSEVARAAYLQALQLGASEEEAQNVASLET